MGGCGAERLRIERVHVGQRSELVRRSTDIRALQNKVLCELVLDAKVVLIRIRRTQVRIDKIHSSVTKSPKCPCHVNVVIHRLRGKRIGIPRR